MLSNKLNLKQLTKDTIYRFIGEEELPGYRAEQLIRWMYKRHVSGIDDITEFSKDLRRRLNEIAVISNLKLAERLRSSDGTEKFLFSLEDGQTIESVLIRNDGRLTLCISSQVGCAMGCLFCLTAKCGLIRNLKSHEIVDQIIAVNRILGNEAVERLSRKEEKGNDSSEAITNIVFMGMGEPLSNFDEVVEALWRIVDFIGISKRKVTLSTSGIVPKILLLPKKAPDINLAVSLNATSDEVRNEIMPVNRRYPIKSVIAACRKYPLPPGRRLTFEYVLIGGKNDSADDAKRLVDLLKGIQCKVNLIPFNPYLGSKLKRPSDYRVLEFQKILLDRHLRAFIRESRGEDILAACGQLRARASREKASTGHVTE
jgi:23S rRNA (adenine2503-C2)-methyltransferase